MSKLLTEQELTIQVSDLITGYTEAKRKSKLALVADVLDLIEEQKKAHGDMVIGKDYKKGGNPFKDDTFTYARTQGSKNVMVNKELALIVNREHKEQRERNK